MTVYIDTSALVPLFIRESKSAAVADWLNDERDRLALSHWCLVEFASALALKVRTGQTTATLAAEATEHLNDFADRYCLMAVPGTSEFHRAATWAGDSGLNLRAGDALHLAIAANLGARAILCLDAAMIRGAKAVGLNVAAV